MGVKVYGVPLSASTRNVMAALYEKGVEFELVPVDLKTGEHKKPNHLKLQPLGKIPVYQDDDITLFESRAINRYIATKYEGQGTPLLGKSLKDRALVDQWMEVEGQNYYALAYTLNFQLFLNKMITGAQPDEAIVAANEEKLNALLDIYEAQLSKTKYLAGDFFSLADIAHYGHTDFLTKNSGRADLINSRPKVAAWWKDISSRPAWRKALAYGSK